MKKIIVKTTEKYNPIISFINISIEDTGSIKKEKNIKACLVLILENYFLRTVFRKYREDHFGVKNCFYYLNLTLFVFLKTKRKTEKQSVFSFFPLFFRIKKQFSKL